MLNIDLRRKRLTYTYKYRRKPFKSAEDVGAKKTTPVYMGGRLPVTDKTYDLEIEQPPTQV